MLLRGKRHEKTNMEKLYQTKSAVFFLNFVVFEFDPSHHQPTNFTVYSIIPQNAKKKNMLEVAPTVAFFPLLLLAGHPGAKPKLEETLL